MESIIYSSYYVLLVMGIIIGFIYTRNRKKVLAYLQNNHKDKLDGLGLSLVSNSKGMSFGDMGKISKFLKSSDYFNDEPLRELKRKTLIYSMTFKVVLILWIIRAIVLYISKNN